MVKIKPFVFNSFQVNTFVLSDETQDAIIIDPACSSDSEKKEIINFIEEQKLSVKYIANTHAHIDHILGVPDLKEHFNVPFYLHSDDQLLLDNAQNSALIFGFDFNTTLAIDCKLDDMQTLEFGNSKLNLLHVPGHSPGSIVFHSNTDNFAIVGDVLFNGSIGRTDLPGGNHGQLIHGIKSKLLTLPSETLVLSGHGPQTTIGNEHDTNPFLV